MRLSSGETTLLKYALILAVGLMGCAKSFNPDIERGSSYNYRSGYPEVRFSAIGLFDDQGEPKINLAADIVYGSLIYLEENDTLVSEVAIDIQIINKEKEEEVIDSKRYTLDIKKQDPNIVYSQEIFTFEKKVPVEPGDYKINFTLTDLNSDKKITSSSQTYIPDPKNKVSNLTNIMMMGKNMNEETPHWSPITTYDVPGRVDSLKFIFQVTNTNSDEPITVDSRLLRFESDNSYTRPMHYNNFSPSSIEYKGIDYDEEEVIQSTQRRLLQPRNVLIEFTFGQQERGNYRFEVNTKGSSEESDLFKARDFSVKSKNYPSIKSARELARPLAYLMDEKEYERMMEIRDADSLKQTVDRFWLRHIGNKNKTKSVIEKYYHRVEEANKQFSNFKEGWKTDPGMVYILFGPPWYVNQRLDEMYWSYSYNRSDPERNFYYYQPRFKSEFFPFEHYLFRRSQSYFSVQYQQIELWLSGLILQRNI
jgi:GWxTD domain-containing protein